MVNTTKPLLLSIIFAAAVISGITVFSFDTNDNEITIPNDTLQEKSEMTDPAISDNMIQENIVSPQGSVPYSPSTGRIANLLGTTIEHSIDYIESEIPYMPVLNQVVTVTTVVDNPVKNENRYAGFFLSDGWEFINVPDSLIDTFEDRENFYRNYHLVPASSEQYQTFTKQIKPTALGLSTFRVSVNNHDSETFILFIGENRTVSIEQYWEENPDKTPPSYTPKEVQSISARHLDFELVMDLLDNGNDIRNIENLDTFALAFDDLIWLSKGFEDHVSPEYKDYIESIDI